MCIRISLSTAHHVSANSAKPALSSGAVAGIGVAAAVALISALIVLYGMWKRRQRHVKMLEHREGSIDEPDLPTNALRTSPFTSSPDLTDGNRTASPEIGWSFFFPMTTLIVDGASVAFTGRPLSPEVREKRGRESSSTNTATFASCTCSHYSSFVQFYLQGGQTILSLHLLAVLDSR